MLLALKKMYPGLTFLGVDQGDKILFFFAKFKIFLSSVESTIFVKNFNDLAKFIVISVSDLP